MKTSRSAEITINRKSTNWNQRQNHINSSSKQTNISHKWRSKARKLQRSKIQKADFIQTPNPNLDPNILVRYVGPFWTLGLLTFRTSGRLAGKLTYTACYIKDHIFTRQTRSERGLTTTASVKFVSRSWKVSQKCRNYIYLQSALFLNMHTQLCIQIRSKTVKRCWTYRLKLC